MTYLDGQFSGWAQNDSLNSALAQQIVLAEVLGHRQAEGQSLATARQVARNHIFSVVDRIERVLLNREQVLDASRHHLLGRRHLDLREACELPVDDCVGLECL